MIDNDDAATNAFFRRAVADGRLSPTEYLELTGRAAAYTPPDWVTLEGAGITYENAMRWEDENRLMPGSLIAYLNYPAYSMTQIAKRLGTKKQRVSRMLNKMRKVFPTLQHDVSVRTNASFPDLRHMQHIEASVNMGRTLDSSRTIKF